jgi:hypothetical protein
MWIQGRRRGGAKDLSKHLQKEENESVRVLELEGFSHGGLTGANLEKALKQIEAIGYGKGDKRNFYHAIVAPAYGCALNAAEQRFMIDYYAEHMGFKGHQRAVVEHSKKGKPHYHLVFNIIDPITGKTHELKFTKLKEWKISRGLEEIFGHPTPAPKGKAARTWEMQRGTRTGIDPRKMRKEVTAIFRVCKNAQEFVAALDNAGYALTQGEKNQLVLVDRFGDTHGLMRRVEGQRLADLRRKFVGIEKMQFQPHAELVKARKASKPTMPDQPLAAINPQRVRDDVQQAYRTSKTGAEFFATLNKREYSLGRGLKGFAVIDKNGGRHDIDKLLDNVVANGLDKKFPDLDVIRPRPVSEIIRRIKPRKTKGAKKSFASAGNAGTGPASIAKQFSPASINLTSFALDPKSSSSYEPTEPAIKASPTRMPVRDKKKSEKRGPDPRPEIPEVEADSSRADAAYQEEFDKWEGLIEAAAKDMGLSKDQRLGAVAALRLRQQMAAQGARKRVLEEEQAIARAIRRARKTLFWEPKHKPQG